MKKFTIIIMFAIIGFSANAQTPEWLWAKTTKSSNNDQIISVATDASENIYMAGIFSSPTIIFGSTTLMNNGSINIFLAKYSANGTVQWAQSAGGTGVDGIHHCGFGAVSVAVDGSGNFYMTGEFRSSSIIFGSTTLTNNTTNGSSDIFLAKYNASGNVQWAKSAGGIAADADAMSVAVDASGNSYVAGSFYCPTIIFGPDTLKNADNTSNSTDVFLAKYDAYGNVLWAKSAFGRLWDGATSVAIDASGNTFLTGYFGSDTITFGSDTLINIYDTGNDIPNIFLVKYDVNGNVLWAKNIGEGGYGQTSVAVDTSGNVYIAGSFGQYYPFLAKYNANGNVLWTKNAEGTTMGIMNSVAVDVSGNAFVAGYFESPIITFGIDTLVTTDTTLNANIFVAKYNTSGNVLWAKNAGGTFDNDIANSIAVGTSGNAYVAGYFESPTITFGTTTLTTVANDAAIFLASIGNYEGIDELENKLNTNIYPNPTKDNITIEAPHQTIIEITNIEGQLIETIATTGNKTNIDVSSFAKGMYFVKVRTEKGVAVKKFIKE